MFELAWSNEMSCKCWMPILPRKFIFADDHQQHFLLWRWNSWHQNCIKMTGSRTKVRFGAQCVNKCGTTRQCSTCLESWPHDASVHCKCKWKIYASCLASKRRQCHIMAASQSYRNDVTNYLINYQRQSQFLWKWYV